MSLGVLENALRALGSIAKPYEWYHLTVKSKRMLWRFGRVDYKKEPGAGAIEIIMRKRIPRRLLFAVLEQQGDTLHL